MMYNKYLGFCSPTYEEIRCRPAVRISGFHPGDPGSIPGNGKVILNYLLYLFCKNVLTFSVIYIMSHSHDYLSH